MLIKCHKPAPVTQEIGLERNVTPQSAELMQMENDTMCREWHIQWTFYELETKERGKKRKKEKSYRKELGRSQRPQV